MGQFGIDNLLRPKIEQPERPAPIELDKVETVSEPMADPPKAEGSTIKGRNIKLSDKTFRRLRLLSIDQDKTISEVCEEVLEDNLPKLSIRKSA